MPQGANGMPLILCHISLSYAKGFVKSLSGGLSAVTVFPVGGSLFWFWQMRKPHRKSWLTCLLEPGWQPRLQSNHILTNNNYVILPILPVPACPRSAPLGELGSSGSVSTLPAENLHYAWFLRGWALWYLPAFGSFTSAATIISCPSTSCENLDFENVSHLPARGLRPRETKSQSTLADIFL